MPALIDAANDQKLRCFGDMEPFASVTQEPGKDRPAWKFTGTALPAKNRRAVAKLEPTPEQIAKLARHDRAAYGAAVANLRKKQNQRARLAEFIADKRSDEHRLAKAQMDDIPKQAKRMQAEVDDARELAAKFVAAAAVVHDPETRERLYRIAKFPGEIKRLRREAEMIADDNGFDVPKLADIELPEGLAAALQRAVRARV